VKFGKDWQAKREVWRLAVAGSPRLKQRQYIVARLQCRTSFPEAPMVAMKRKVIRPDALFLPARAKV